MAAVAVVVLVLVPLVNEVFLGWLDAPRSFWPDAIQALLLRVNILIIGWMALDVYGVLIREGDRPVLALWPVDPAAVVRFEVQRIGVRRLFLPFAAGALLGPIAWVDPWLWGLCLLQIIGCWVLSLVCSALVVLVAVDAAHSPKMRPFLDLIRGNNHPAQAAFLYAPAFVLWGVGAVLMVAGIGVSWLHAGQALGALLLGLPFAVVPFAWMPIPRLARRNWFRAGQAMAEVDARYAQIEEKEDAMRVYFDWFVRFLPADLARFTLLDLRQGWRVRRSWLMGAWLGGIASLVAAWTADPSGPQRSAVVATLGVWIVAAVALELRRGEPEFLQRFLPNPTSKQLGRVVALLLWLQPIVWMGALAAGVRQGVGAFGLVFTAAAISAVFAALLATACARRGGLVAYGPLAAVGALMVMRGVMA